MRRSYRNVLLATRPIGLWQMGDRLTSAAPRDLSGFGRDLGARLSTTTPEVRGGASPGGLAGGFTQRNGTTNGESGWRATGITAFRLGSLFTYGGWLRIDNSVALAAGPALMGNWGGASVGHMLYVMDTSGDLQVYRGNGTGGNISAIAGEVTALRDGRWHRVSLSADATTIRYYRDGLLRHESAYTPSTPTTDFTVGFYNSAQNNGTSPPNIPADWAWVGFWGRVLSAAEERRLWAEGAGRVQLPQAA